MEVFEVSEEVEVGSKVRLEHTTQPLTVFGVVRRIQRNTSCLWLYGFELPYHWNKPNVWRVILSELPEATQTN